MSRIPLFLLSIVLIAFCGCGTQQDAESNLEEDKVSNTTVARTIPKAVIPSGTKLEIRLSDSLSTAQNQSGEAFKSILNTDVEVDGKIVVARGSIVMGTLSNVQQSGRTKGRAAMSMRLTELLTDGGSYPIQTEILSFEAESTKKKDATKIGVGTGIGAVVGAIAGGGKGAAIGAAIGGGAGTATVLATRGDELEFPPEQLFQFILAEGLEVTLP